METSTMAVPITTLELRSIDIPRSPLIEALERVSGKAITHEHRHFLAGRPVHCGDILELFQKGRWIHGRYEWTAQRNQPPTFESADGVWVLSESDLLRWPK